MDQLSRIPPEEVVGDVAAHTVETLQEQLNCEAIRNELDALDRERRWIKFQMNQNQKGEAKKWKEEFAKKKEEG